MKTTITKFYYGDIPEDKAGGTAPTNKPDEKTAWPLWEIFVRSKQGPDNKRVGGLNAADAPMAIENARDISTRRQEGISIWAVESRYIHASSPDDAESFYEPAEDKIYRHPTFYELPDEVNHM